MLQSFFVHNVDEEGFAFVVMDTVIDGKRLVTSLGVGQIKNGEPLLSQTGNRALARACDYADQAGQGKVFLVEVARFAKAPAKVRQAVAAAAEEDLVFFICRDKQTYDEGFRLLNASFPAAVRQ